MHHPVLNRALEAGAAIKARRFVQIGTSDGAAVTADADSDTTITGRPLGISADVDVPEDGTVDVHMPGIADCVAGAAVTRGSSLKADGAGRAIATATARDFTVGIALEAAAAAGDIIPVLIAPQRIRGA